MGLPDLVSRIGVTLRNRLGTVSPSTELLAQISNAQPPSVDVAQKLSMARQAMQHYDAAKARDELLEVIAESPGYAPAYASLSDAWSALGYREKAVAAARQAVTHGSGLPSEMQLQIDAVLQAANYQWGPHPFTASSRAAPKAAKAVRGRLCMVDITSC